MILFVRRNLPENPRWLITHGREQEALASMKHIEQSAIDDGQHLAPVSDADAISMSRKKTTGT